MNWWQLAAGLAILIFAFSLMEESVKILAGRPFKKFLQQQTQHKFRAVIGGTVVTAFLQSSSVVLMMILSFVGAGILNMRNALAIILGSNLGTTLDSWVVATLGFRIPTTELYFPLLALSLTGLIFFSFHKKIYNLSRFLVGFALVFIGLSWMKESAMGLVEHLDLKKFSGMSPFVFLPVGFILTSIIQSSSATMAIALTALNSHILFIDQAAAVVIGSELGTAIKLLLGSIGGIAEKKRVAWGNFYFNLVTLIVASALLSPLLQFVTWILPTGDPLIMLVAFQSTINLMSILIFYPLLGRFATFLEATIRNPSGESLTLYIKRSGNHAEEKSIGLAEKETIHLIRKAIQLNQLSFGIEIEKEPDESAFRIRGRFSVPGISFTENYNRLKMLQGEILEYILEIQHDNPEKQDIERNGILVTVCRNVIHAVKNIKDIRHNLQDLADTANDHLYDLFQKLRASEKLFYPELEKNLLVRNAEEARFQALHDLNKLHHQQSIDSTLQLLNKQLITELEASTLLNVFREVYSSHKALITAVEDLAELEMEL